MSSGQSESNAPSSSARLIDVSDLPIALIDIELSAPTAQLVGDKTVFLLRRGQGPPAAVLKMARGLLRAAEMRMQRRVLAELALHHGLGEEWRELLPRILAFDERAGATVSVESYRPGMDLMEALARRPNRVEELTAAALSAIAPLHRQTATFVDVDNLCSSRQWLVEPLAGLTDMCRRLDPRLLPEVSRLRRVLWRALGGVGMPVSWTHGGFTPDHVRVAGVRGPVTGVVGWGGARRDRPALIDEYLMILTASCQVERADLGAIVTERLRAGGLSGPERHALRAAREQSGAAIDDRERIDERIDVRIAILLTWLHRVADLWRKRAALPNHHVWWATNVAPVLDTVAESHRFEGGAAL